ncbi:mitochondrial 2-enoyl thioester reductase [Scheffersomyces xylosifermentans]|uniref:mitochondrial 2-enoyl thioester reductase n=1 Tax=Scheffersomyces xylosifermentans TaxID=1304137 RepID=UPI00315D0A25
MSIKAHSITYTKHGTVFKDTLNLTEFTIDPEKLQPNQVIVETLSSAINPSDLSAIRGGYAAPNIQYLNAKEPVFIPGNEGVLRVSHVGSEVKNYKVGDWVVPRFSKFGTWRTHALVTIDKDEEPFILVSNDEDSLPVNEAGTIAINPPTADQLVEFFVKDWKDDGNDWIIQNSGNSQVSKFVTQFASLKNIKTISIVRDGKSDEEIKQLYDFGATKVFSESEFSSEEFYTETLPQLIGDKGRVRLALNSVGGKTVAGLVRSLSFNGIVVSYGVISGEPVTFDSKIQLYNNITLSVYYLNFYPYTGAEKKVESINKAVKLYKEGKLKDIPFTKAEYKKGDNLLEVFLAAIDASKKGKQVVVYS